MRQFFTNENGGIAKGTPLQWLISIAYTIGVIALVSFIGEKGNLSEGFQILIGIVLYLGGIYVIYFGVAWVSERRGTTSPNNSLKKSEYELKNKVIPLGRSFLQTEKDTLIEHILIHWDDGNTIKNTALPFAEMNQFPLSRVIEVTHNQKISFWVIDKEYQKTLCWTWTYEKRSDKPGVELWDSWNIEGEYSLLIGIQKTGRITVSKIYTNLIIEMEEVIIDGVRYDIKKDFAFRDIIRDNNLNRL
jgi:hypothetical protein